MSKRVSWGKNVYGMMRYLKKVAAGHYQLKWQGDVVDILKVDGPTKARNWHVSLNGSLVATRGTFNAAVSWVDNVWGTEPVKTRNLLNPAAGEIEIPRKNVGGCCDPGTEQYHTL